MCTVSWWRRDGKLSLRFNRDEQRGRAEAEPPVLRQNLLYPRDPLGGGTWICVDQKGTVHCLLNYYDAKEPKLPENPRTRGELPILSAKNTGPFREWLEPEAYPPFHLLRVPRIAPISHITWNGHHLTDGPAHSDITHWTTSGWNATNVVQARAALFQQMLENQGLSEETLSNFHAHQLPDPFGFGPRMSRSDARTVSISEIKMDPQAFFFQYVPVNDQGMLPPHETHQLLQA